MYYAVDKIVDDIVVLENLDTNKLLEVNKLLFNDDIHDGTILKKVDDNYIVDDNYEEVRRDKLREKLNKLKNL